MRGFLWFFWSCSWKVSRNVGMERSIASYWMWYIQGKYQCIKSTEMRGMNTNPSPILRYCSSVSGSVTSINILMCRNWWKPGCRIIWSLCNGWKNTLMSIMMATNMILFKEDMATKQISDFQNEKPRSFLDFLWQSQAWRRILMFRKVI